RFRLVVPGASASESSGSSGSSASSGSSVRLWTHAPDDHSGFPPLVLDDVPANASGLLLRIEEERHRAGTLSGRVIDSQGRPLSARLQVWHEELALWRGFETEADTGAFRIPQLPPGRIRLRIAPRTHPWVDLDPVIVAGTEHDL